MLASQCVRAVLTEKSISICLSSLLDFISQKKKINTERESEGKIEHFRSICFSVFTYFSAPVHFLLLSASLSPNVFFIINVSVLSLSLSQSVCGGLTSIALSFFLSCDEVRYWKLSIMLFEPLQENISLNINLNTNTITNTDSAWYGFYQRPDCTTHMHKNVRTASFICILSQACQNDWHIFYIFPS